MISIKSFPLDINAVPIKKEMGNIGTPPYKLMFQLHCKWRCIQQTGHKSRHVIISPSRKLRIQFSSWKIKGNCTLAFPLSSAILFPHVPKIREARLVALKFHIRLTSFSVLCPGLFTVVFWSHSTSSAWQGLDSLFFYLWVSSLDRKQWAVPKGNASSSCLWASGRCVLAVCAGHSNDAWCKVPLGLWALVCIY